MTQNPDRLYAVLGLGIDATQDEIKKAYRALSKEHHPDKNGGKHSEEFIAVQEAYEVLSDPVKKHKYDTVGEYDTGGAEEDRIAQEAADLVLSMVPRAMLHEITDLIKLSVQHIERSIQDVARKQVDCAQRAERMRDIASRLSNKDGSECRAAGMMKQFAEQLERERDDGDVLKENLRKLRVEVEKMQYRTDQNSHTVQDAWRFLAERSQ